MIRPPHALPTLRLVEVGDQMTCHVHGKCDHEKFMQVSDQYERTFHCGTALAMELAADELELSVVFDGLAVDR